MCVCMYVYMSVCMYVYVCMCVYMALYCVHFSQQTNQRNTHSIDENKKDEGERDSNDNETKNLLPQFDQEVHDKLMELLMTFAQTELASFPPSFAAVINKSNLDDQVRSGM